MPKDGVKGTNLDIGLKSAFLGAKTKEILQKNKSGKVFFTC